MPRSSSLTVGASSALLCMLEIVGSGAAVADGQIVTVTNYLGVTKRFEFNSAGGVAAGNIAVAFNSSTATM